MHINEKKRFFLFVSGVFGRFLPILFWILLIYGFDEPYVAGLTLLSAAVHEGGHLLAAWLSGTEVRLFGVIFGMRIRRTRRRSYAEEIKILAAGPLVNLAFCALGFTLLPLCGEYALHLAVINLFTALSNLLPIRGHDGYGILSFLLEWKQSPPILYAILNALSFTLTTLFCVTALYLMERFDAGYWIWVLFTAALLSEMKRGVKYIKSDVS